MQLKLICSMFFSFGMSVGWMQGSGRLKQNVPAIILTTAWGFQHMIQYFESSDLNYTVFKYSVLSITYLG